MNLKSFV